MQSPDHPELLFIEARKTDGSPMYTIGRPDGPPLWVVVHDMEAVETTSCAENTANYFASGAGGRSVSSHYCADNNSVVQCVLLKDSAWTVGNRPGNNRGINWEFCGLAAQTRAQWLDPFGVAMFERAAPIIHSDSVKYGIPLERRTIAELQAWKKGVTSHNDLRLAFGITNHTDPGANFPWDYFIDLLNGVDVLTAIQTKDINGDPILVYPWNGTWRRIPKSMPQALTNALEALEIASVAVKVLPGPYDMADPLILASWGVDVEASATGGGATPTQVRTVVREELNKTKLAGT